jgi:hypothetical protein
MIFLSLKDMMRMNERAFRRSIQQALDEGALVRLFPNNLTHPNQKYCMTDKAKMCGGVNGKR